MQPIGDLVINIVADSKQATTVLKSFSDTVSNTIDKVNNGGLDWQKILAGSLDLSIISGIASTFALAIEQAVQFQNATMNMNNVVTPATTALAGSIGQIGGQAYNLAESSGQSLGDAASAFEAFSKAGLDSAAATTAVNEASQIAYATGEDYKAVVTELVGLFQNWGVTSAPQVTAALTGLANASQNGKFSFDELIAAMSPQGSVLSTKTNISDTAISLATLSTQSGLTKDAIIDTFAQISTAASQGLANPINNLVGSMSKTISTGPDGLITAFQKIGSFINQSGPNMAGIWGQSIGIMQGDVSSFENTTKTSFANTATAANTLNGHLKTLGDITSTNTSEATKLSIAWKDFITKMDTFVLPPALKLLEITLDDINASIDLITAFFAKPPVATVQGKPSTVGNMSGSTPSGGLNLDVLSGTSGLGSKASLDALGSTIASSIGSWLTNNSKSSATNMPTNTSTQVNITSNISGAGGNASAVGGHVATQLYNSFLGTQ